MGKNCIEKGSLFPFRVFNDLNEILPEVWRDFKRVQRPNADLDELRQNCRKYVEVGYTRPHMVKNELLGRSDVVRLLRELILGAILQGSLFEVTSEDGVFFPKMVLVENDRVKDDLTRFRRVRERDAAVEAVVHTPFPEGISYETMVVGADSGNHQDNDLRCIGGHIRMKAGVLTCTLLRFNKGVYTYTWDRKQGFCGKAPDGAEWERVALALTLAVAQSIRASANPLAAGKGHNSLYASSRKNIRLDDGGITVINAHTEASHKALRTPGPPAPNVGVPHRPHTRAGCTARMKSGKVVQRRPCIVHKEEFKNLQSCTKVK